MKNRSRAATGVLAALCLWTGLNAGAQTENQPPVPGAAQRGTVMATRATGTFEVKLTPRPTDDKSEDAALSRMSIEKQFHGDLEGISKGQMLAAATEVKGSAAYVAIERVGGTLHGRSGSFVLQHMAP